MLVNLLSALLSVLLAFYGVAYFFYAVVSFLIRRIPLHVLYALLGCLCVQVPLCLYALEIFSCPTGYSFVIRSLQSFIGTYNISPGYNPSTKLTTLWDVCSPMRARIPTPVPYQHILYHYHPTSIRNTRRVIFEPMRVWACYSRTLGYECGGETGGTHVIQYKCVPQSVFDFLKDLYEFRKRDGARPEDCTCNSLVTHLRLITRTPVDQWMHGPWLNGFKSIHTVRSPQFYYPILFEDVDDY